MASAEEMAELQKLSIDYTPDVVGDLVGRRQSSNAIMDEYVDADVIYIRKTRALATRFRHYRPVKGDGNCGWRALAFGYFELLLHTADRGMIKQESARLNSYNTLLNSVGYDQDLYIDFVQETLDLLEQMAASVASPDGASKLLASFNDEGISNSIITHFRLITSVWMKSNAATYEPFLLNVTIDQYRAAHIDPYQVEIEHLGMHACIDAILKPAGFAVDVMYLDRSEGDEVNIINWEPDVPSGRGITPRLRLLYRPGHYDILYKEDDHININFADMAHPQVHIVSTHDPSWMQPSHHVADPFSAIDTDSWLHIPGMSHASSFYSAPFQDIEPQLNPVVPEHFSSPTQPLPPPPSSFSDHAFRITKYQLDVDYGQQASPHAEPCQTDAMKQAGESPAHYKNEQFQPLIWSPENEYKSGREPESHSRRPS